MMTQRTTMRSGVVDVPTELIYVRTDPYAVTLEFTEYDGEVILWQVARDSLWVGLQTHRPIGEGDLLCHVCTCLGTRMFHVTLSVPDHTAHLHGGIEEFRAFLYETYQIVPSGRENDEIDYEREIAKLLSS